MLQFVVFPMVMPTPTEYSLLSTQLSFTGGHLQSIAPSLCLINISLTLHEDVCSIGKLVMPTPTEHSLLSNFIHWWTPAEVTYPLAPSLCIVKQFICYFSFYWNAGNVHTCRIVICPLVDTCRDSISSCTISLQLTIY